MKQAEFSPRAFMRDRNPELYSDTLEVSEPVLERNFFEYYLETLTNRKQEQEFEEFCRRLAEAEICPNLKPQTGPTGGGDGKTDSKSYPVSPYLAERVYWGSPVPATDENWAFAFSCKKAWKPKVKDDVEKIAGLDRTFTKVYFISNQFIREKTSAELEQELSQEYGFEVYILDRNWIINRVIEHRREGLAIESLGIQAAETKKPQLGPRDSVRQQQLDSLLIKLGQIDSYYGNDYAMAQDYLEAAKLARGIGKPRHEVDGLFTRARNLSQTVGYRGLILRSGYHHAWTSLWWYDDPIALERIYGEIEPYLPDTVDADECELFCNLWCVIHGSVSLGHLSEGVAKLEDRLQVLKSVLDSLAADKERPNNALIAETRLYLLELVGNKADERSMRQTFAGLKKCLKRSRGLGTYPALEFINTIQELGEYLGDLPGYDSLFQEMRRVIKARIGETSEGKLLYERGMQLIGQNNPQESLRYLGEARFKLAKEETLRESLRAGLGCAYCYSDMGLFWAARMEAIAVAHAALRRVETFYEYPLEGFLSIELLCSLELRLGRVAPFITWYKLGRFLLYQLDTMGYEINKFEEELRIQEWCLGCFFLNLSAHDAQELIGIWDALNEAGLSMAAVALKYKTGSISSIQNELPEDIASDKKKIIDFFHKWKSQPASDQQPKSLNGETGPQCRYETYIMGVCYSVQTTNAFAPIAFAENLLAIIEAALALAKWENLAFVIDRVDISVKVSEAGNNPPLLVLDRPLENLLYEFTWKPDMLEWLNQGSRNQVEDYLKTFLLNLLFNITIDPFKELKRELDQWHKEYAFSRALGTSPLSIPLGDILGETGYDLSK